MHFFKRILKVPFIWEDFSVRGNGKESKLCFDCYGYHCQHFFPTKLPLELSLREKPFLFFIIILLSGESWSYFMRQSIRLPFSWFRTPTFFWDHPVFLSWFLWPESPLKASVLSVHRRAHRIIKIPQILSMKVRGDDFIWNGYIKKQSTI